MRVLTGQSCSTGDVRLVGGSGSHEGRVEICRYSGTWNTVCDNGWDDTDAGVVCRQLGFAYQGNSIKKIGLVLQVLFANDPGAIARSNASFGQGHVSIYYTRFGCNGQESRILNCNYGYYYNYYYYYYDYCDHSDDAGVTCRPFTTITSLIEQSRIISIIILCTR